MKYDNKKCDEKKCDDKKCDNRKKIDPVSYFYMLIEKFMESDKRANISMDKALDELRDAICKLENGMDYNEYSGKIGEKIDKWLDTFMCKYLCKEEICECDDIRKELHAILEKILREEYEAYKLMKEAEKKLARSRKMNEKYQKLLKCVAENCYPKKKC